MMALSRKDKEEIAAMFQSFSEMQRPAMRPEDMLLQAAIEYAAPRVTAGAQTFAAQPRFVPFPERIVGAAIETALVPTKRKKAMTKFNRAVKEGMKIAKSSTSYGKKGTISNSKKAFSAVTKTVAKARKGGKAPVKGVLRKVFMKAKGIIGKERLSRFMKGKKPKGYRLRR
jgi:hypothetical protein